MIRGLAAACVLAIGLAAGSQAVRSATAGPLIYWTRGTDTAPALRAAGIDRFAVPEQQAPAWHELGFDVTAISSLELTQRLKLVAPRIAGRANVASATRRPWIDANGWQFIRHPGAKFQYELPPGRALPAIAESHAWGADALLRIDPADLDDAGRMLAFISRLPRNDLPAVADIGLIDNGSPQIDEVLNLFVRRNLLFSLIKSPSPRYRLNIRIGSKEFPESAAADPNEFALEVRRKLGDENRSLRVYGTETVLCRLTGDGAKARIFLINYSGRDADSLRIKLRGVFRQSRIHAFGVENAALEDVVNIDGSTEFSISRLGWYAVIDLE
ncbi:MAG: hypothetical protein AB7H86_09115 [Blastocatellales bacterium]